MGYKSAEEDHRGQLLARIQTLESQLATARTQLAALDSQETDRTPTKEMPEPRSSPHTSLAPLLSVTADSPVEDKIALFMARFTGRTDVYATRWISKTTGKQGWGPALRHKYKRQPTPSDFLPFTPSVVDTQLRRSAAHGTHNQDTFHAGIYPMLPGDRCQLLVCDFDDGNWKSDAAAYANACNNAGIHVLTEISRSGQGAHVWIFLEKPMSAARVRSAGTSLLRHAMETNPKMSFSSHDR